MQLLELPSNDYNVPPVPQQQKPSQHQPNLYGAPKSRGALYGVSPHPETSCGQPQLYTPEQGQRVATDADVPGLTETSAGVRCMTTGTRSSFFTAFGVGLLVIALMLGAWGVYNIAAGFYVHGSGQLVVCIPLLIGVVLWSRRTTLASFTTVFDNNSRTVSITRKGLLTPCCSNVETINYSAIQTICHESQLGRPKSEGSTERNVEPSIYFLNLVSGKCGVPIGHDSEQRDDVGVSAAARIADIINSAGYFVTVETRVNRSRVW